MSTHQKPPTARSRRAPRNRTIALTDDDRRQYGSLLRQVRCPVLIEDVLDCTVCQDVFDVLEFLPGAAFHLVLADPPYNLTRDFNGTVFRQTELEDYQRWLESWIPRMRRLLKPEGSIYVCGDWRSSAAIHRVLGEHFQIRSRITWEREKGRGAKSNWKSSSEDIWFATVSNRYTFNVDAVKLRRRVMAPYTDSSGRPKDWSQTGEGRYRNTHPSNIWTDVTVPFWSMAENTDHPTQKPEKLVAKMILASSKEGQVVFDPFLGSGTSSVVAKKLGRHYVGVEIDADYCCLAEKRLALADADRSIQGYTEGVFWERNTLVGRADSRKRDAPDRRQPGLFDDCVLRGGSGE